MDGPFRKAFGSLETWARWQTVLKSIYGLPLSLTELGEFREMSGRMEPPEGGASEAFFIMGRRSGKSHISSFIAAYEAIFGNWEERVNPGDPFHIFILSETKEQSKIIFDKIGKFLEPFKSLVERETREEILLSNGADIRIMAADYRTVRGFTTALVILDELGSFSSDPDELINALTPSLLPGGRLLGLSSRGPDFGSLWNLRQRFFGVEDAETLILMAKTMDMNPTYDESKIKKEFARDSRTAREYDPFVEDGTNLFPEALIREAATIRGDEPPIDGVRYVAFIDMASQRERLALALAGAFNGIIHVPVIREVSPKKNIMEILGNFADIICAYKIQEVFSDQYAFGSTESILNARTNVVKRFKLDRLKVSKSQCYFDLRSALDRREVALPANDNLLCELLNLEVKKSRSGGTEIVDHRRNGFDDVANAVAGAVKGWYSTNKANYGIPVAAEATVTMHKQHPIQQQEIERTLVRTEKECLAQSEKEWKKWAEESLGPLTPVHHGPEETDEEYEERIKNRPPQVKWR